MDKKIIFILLISLSIFIIGCGNKNIVQTASDAASSQGISYKLAKKTYTNKNITINYPQIINLDNKDKQNVINKLIKNDALTDFSDGVDDNLDLKLNYVIKLENEDMLSIQYSGVGYYKDSSYPNNWFFTTNIDIKNEKKIKLPDLVKIDETFVNAFKNGKYIDYEPADNSENNAELQSAVIEYINNIDTKDLIMYFNQSDSRSVEENPSNVYSYLTKDSIVISISVPHPLGDHAEFQIDYGNIQSSKDTNNELWQKLLNPS